MKLLNWLWLKISYEPAMFLEVVKQIVGGLVIFNFIQPSAEQLAWINLFSGMLLQFVVRQTSFASAKVEDAVGKEAAKEIAATTGAVGTTFVEPK